MGGSVLSLVGKITCNEINGIFGVKITARLKTHALLYKEMPHSHFPPLPWQYDGKTPFFPLDRKMFGFCVF